METADPVRELLEERVSTSDDFRVRPINGTLGARYGDCFHEAGTIYIVVTNGSVRIATARVDEEGRGFGSRDTTMITGPGVYSIGERYAYAVVCMSASANIAICRPDDDFAGTPYGLGDL